jgi:hypothetical protein
MVEMSCFCWEAHSAFRGPMLEFVEIEMQQDLSIQPLTNSTRVCKNNKLQFMIQEARG